MRSFVSPIAPAFPPLPLWIGPECIGFPRLLAFRRIFLLIGGGQPRPCGGLFLAQAAWLPRGASSALDHLFTVDAASLTMFKKIKEQLRM